MRASRSSSKLIAISWMIGTVQHALSQRCDPLNQPCDTREIDQDQCNADPIGICRNVDTALRTVRMCLDQNLSGRQGTCGDAEDDCVCIGGVCREAGTRGICRSTMGPVEPAPTPSPICPSGSLICLDPHVRGLRGQHLEVTGDDGGWYCLLKDDVIDLHVNVRFTAPLPAEFPHRQLVTGLAILSGDHSFVVEARNPYDTACNCPAGISPCLANGGLTVTVDGLEVEELLRPTRDEPVVEGIDLSASNLPVECQQFGGHRIWARMYEEMLQGKRQLRSGRFEDWVLRFKDMAAHDWCTKFISEHGELGHVQSKHAVFRIDTPFVEIRLSAGVNHQGEGEQDWDGRELPELDFWQMDIGFEGLSPEHREITGFLGETARPVLDDHGLEITSGPDALRGTIEDYRVADAVGTHFPLLEQQDE